MASKKRGLSLEEKRKRLLEIFYEKKDVFQLKELEKLGPQEKGIVSQSVKEVLQSLVDDGYVDNERIGSSQYFWALPSKATQVRKRKLEELEEQVKQTGEKAEELVQETKRAKMDRIQTAERDELIANIVKMQAEQRLLKTQLEAYQDSDPDVIEAERRDIQAFMDAANRWTENIMGLRTWLKDKFGMSEQEINNKFGISDEFDFVEL